MSHQLEREVKLLLDRAPIDLSLAVGTKEIRQVYLLSGPGTIRVRAYQDGSHELTLKFNRSSETSSEYNLSLAEELGPRLYAEAIEQGFPEISKTRYLMPASGPGMEGLTYELDLFHGRFDFLTLCELEYPGEERPEGLRERPAWYPSGPWGVDVTAHGGFRNSRLVQLDAEGVEALRVEFEEILSG